MISLAIVFLLGRQSAFRDHPLMSSSLSSSSSSSSSSLSTPTVSSSGVPSRHREDYGARPGLRTRGSRSKAGNGSAGERGISSHPSPSTKTKMTSNASRSVVVGNKATRNDDTAISTATSKVHVTNANDVHDNYIACRMPHESEWLLLETADASPTPLENNNNDDDNVGITMIPRILHKVIITTNGGFPTYLSTILEMMTNETMRHEYINNNSDDNNNSSSYTGSIEEAHISWYINNPTYDIRYYDLHRCRLYLKQYYHPLFLRAFDCIEAFAGKVNFFRYLVVYREGGYYSDWKQYCMKVGLLDYLSTHNSTEQPRWKASVTTSAQRTTWFSCWGTTPSHRTMQNAFFGAVPKSPILAAAIYKSLTNIQSRADLLPNAQSLFMTGVGVLHEAIYTASASAVAAGKNTSLPGIRLGVYKYGPVKYFTYQNENIIIHKCAKCGQDQSWGDEGNNYEKKLRLGEYFCPDAPSLFVAPSSPDDDDDDDDDDDKSRFATSNHDANTSSTLIGQPCFW